MKIRCIVPVLLLVLCLSGQAQDNSARRPNSPPKKAAPATPEQNSTIQRLLEESNGAIRELSSDARIPLMARLCESAARASLRDLQEEWCEQVLREAQNSLSPGKDQAIIQSRAAAAMTDISPNRALEMLETIVAADAESSAVLIGSSRTVFDALLAKQGAKGYPSVKEAAAALGDTGYFPYTAMATVFARLPKNRDICDDAFQQSLSYFRQQSERWESEAQFGNMVRMASREKCISDWILQQGASELADAVLRQMKLLLSNPASVDQSDYNHVRMLYDIARTSLETIDPTLARLVAKSYDQVSNLKPTHSDTQVPLDPQYKTYSDPELTNLRSEIVKQLSVVNSTRHGDSGHSSEVRQALATGFAVGEKYAARAASLDPEHASAMKRNANSLGQLVRAGMSIWPEATIEQIERIQDSELKASLLLDAAQSLQRLTRRPLPPANSRSETVTLE